MAIGVLSRRKLLSLAALGTAAATVGGCAQDHMVAEPAPRFATYLPPSYEDLFPGLERFFDVASRSSGGTLTFNKFDSGSLVDAGQLIPALLMDAADLIFTPSSYVTSSFPILGATQIPFVTNSYATQRRAMNPDGLVREIINHVLAQANLCTLGGMPASFEYLWTMDAPIRKPQDVAGRRIRVSGEIAGVTVEALGGAPVFMSSSEAYQALERGTIDGIMCYVGTVFGRDLQQVLRYGTGAHFSAYTNDIYCRKDWYDSRSPDIRNALDTAGRVLYRQGTANMLTVHQQKYLPEIKAAGVQLIEPSDAELATFRAAVQPAYDHWRSMLGDNELASTVIDLIKKA